MSAFYITFSSYYELFKYCLKQLLDFSSNVYVVTGLFLSPWLLSSLVPIHFLSSVAFPFVTGPGGATRSLPPLTTQPAQKIPGTSLVRELSNPLVLSGFGSMAYTDWQAERADK